MVVPEKPKTSAKKKPARSWSRKKLALAVLIFLVGCGGAAVGVSALIGTPIHLPSFSKPQVIDFPEPHYVPSLVGRYDGYHHHQQRMGAICSSSASNMSMMTPFPKGLSSVRRLMPG